tara:strand:- start:3473 stop:3880 length:408 start_codon:yes stop_codon:yes gene_type:complete
MKKLARTGIWLDFEKAYIIELHENQENITKIDSNIEHFNVVGGSRSKQAHGPQDNVSESKYLERNNQQQATYFKSIIEKINPNNELVIFGPAEAKMNLKKAFQNHSNFKQKAIPVETADSITENQMKAWVRDYKI